MTAFKGTPPERLSKASLSSVVKITAGPAPRLRDIGAGFYLVTVVAMVQAGSPAAASQLVQDTLLETKEGAT